MREFVIAKKAEIGECSEMFDFGALGGGSELRMRSEA